MNVMNVRRLGDPILRAKARKVSRFSFDLQRITMAMTDTLHVYGGLGLSGPQVGVPLRIAIVETPEMEIPLVLVNPEITEAAGEEAGIEGCLSIPGYVGEVKRATSIKYRYQDVRGKKIKAKTNKPFLARVIQHEVDHLNGVLFIDYIDFSKKENSPDYTVPIEG